VSLYAKAVNAETREIRMVKVNRAVHGMLARHDTHWAKRSNGRGGFMKLDVLIISDPELWQRLLPYFTYELEKSGHGRKHTPQVVED
jgi:hypothetical protein